MCNYLKVKPGNKKSVKLSSLQRRRRGQDSWKQPQRGHTEWRGPPNPFYGFFSSPLAKYTDKSYFGLFPPATMTLDSPKALCR